MRAITRRGPDETYRLALLPTDGPWWDDAKEPTEEELTEFGADGLRVSLAWALGVANQGDGQNAAQTPTLSEMLEMVRSLREEKLSWVVSALELDSRNKLDDIHALVCCKREVLPLCQECVKEPTDGSATLCKRCVIVHHIKKQTRWIHRLAEVVGVTPNLDDIYCTIEKLIAWPPDDRQCHCGGSPRFMAYKAGVTFECDRCSEGPALAATRSAAVIAWNTRNRTAATILATERDAAMKDVGEMRVKLQAANAEKQALAEKLQRIVELADG